MSNKITMPDYTRVGYVAKHAEKHMMHDGKIHEAGMALKRSGGERSSYHPNQIDSGFSKDGKIHAAGIPLKHDTGGTVCPVPAGKMRGKGDTNQ